MVEAGSSVPAQFEARLAHFDQQRHNRLNAALAIKVWLCRGPASPVDEQIVSTSHRMKQQRISPYPESRTLIAPMYVLDMHEARNLAFCIICAYRTTLTSVTVTAGGYISGGHSGCLVCAGDVCGALQAGYRQCSGGAGSCWCCGAPVGVLQ